MNKVQIITVSFFQICLRSEGISSTCTVTINSDLMENLGYIFGALSWITLWRAAAVNGIQHSTWEAMSALRIQAQNQIKMRWAKLCARNPEMLLESQEH